VSARADAGGRGGGAGGAGAQAEGAEAGGASCGRRQAVGVGGGLGGWRPERLGQRRAGRAPEAGRRQRGSWTGGAQEGPA
jgi:hypothetical protein